jgi:phosphatidyl-myo-inositol dimannoside synthase
MRILMLNNEFPPLGGGTGTANHALLRHFVQIPDLEIDLITSALGAQKEEENFSERITILKVPVKNRNIHHSSNRELLAYAARALSLALKQHRIRRYEFCFAWSALPAGFVAMTLKKILNLPYIVRVCGPDIPGFERRYQPIYPVVSPIIRSVWQHAAVVVAKSDGEKEMIRAFDRNTEVTLVPNGVDLAVFQPDAAIPDDGPLRLLCVARLIERKGQHHLIEAVKRLTDAGVEVTLDLVGTGDARVSYERQTRGLALNGRVDFLGYIPRGKIAEYYARGHVFVLPSYNEGMSIATLEAMAAGLPVVTTRTPGAAELVEEGINGLTFAWGDIDGLTTHLHLLATDRDLTRRMGAASRTRAAHFTWDTAAAAYLDLFQQAMIQQPPTLSSRKSNHPIEL